MQHSWFGMRNTRRFCQRMEQGSFNLSHSTEFCSGQIHLLYAPRMVKKLMRLRVRSISGAPEPFATLHRALTLCVLADGRKEQYVALALMVPLVMNMLHVLR